MYAKPPISSFLLLAGITAPPSMSPAARTARLMLQIVGIGFGFYCTAAAALLLTAFVFRRRNPAVRPGSWNGS